MKKIFIVVMKEKNLQKRYSGLKLFLLSTSENLDMISVTISEKYYVGFNVRNLLIMLITLMYSIVILAVVLVLLHGKK